MTPGSDGHPPGEPSRRLAQSRTALVRRGAFGVALLERDGSRARVLTGTGVAVWDSFERPATVAAVTERLAERYGADSAVVAGDVDALVSELRSLALLVDR